MRWEAPKEMKKLIIILALCLSGCSTLTSLWPKPHDPVMFDNLVSTKIAVEKLSCEDKNWTDAETKLQHLKVYSELRKDPQAISIAQLQEAISKAKASDKKLFCESILKINKTRIDVIVDAWKGR
jgi:uncharacterized protein YceK